jgi:hypothetical protein
MSLGRIINLRDWKNNKSGRWRETERETEEGERTLLLSPGCCAVYIVWNYAFSNFQLWNYYCIISWKG